MNTFMLCLLVLLYSSNLIAQTLIGEISWSQYVDGTKKTSGDHQILQNKYDEKIILPSKKIKCAASLLNAFGMTSLTLNCTEPKSKIAFDTSAECSNVPTFFKIFLDKDLGLRGETLSFIMKCSQFEKSK